MNKLHRVTSCWIIIGIYSCILLDNCWHTVSFLLHFIPWRPPGPFLRRGAGTEQTVKLFKNFLLGPLCISLFQITQHKQRDFFCPATSFDLQYMSSSGQLYKNMKVNNKYREIGNLHLIILQYIKNVYTIYKVIVICKRPEEIAKELRN